VSLLGVHRLGARERRARRRRRHVDACGVRARRRTTDDARDASIARSKKP
jgi:hypothetical protein